MAVDVQLRASRCLHNPQSRYETRNPVATVGDLLRTCIPS